jgi:hypothetical protein
MTFFVNATDDVQIQNPFKIEALTLSSILQVAKIDRLLFKMRIAGSGIGLKSKKAGRRTVKGRRNGLVLVGKWLIGGGSVDVDFSDCAFYPTSRILTWQMRNGLFVATRLTACRSFTWPGCQ